MRPTPTFRSPPSSKAGYGAVWRGQKTWNGVAILARNADPVLIRDRAARRSATTTRRATSKPPSTASSSPASICRTAIRSPGRNSTTSSTGSSGCASHAAKFLKQDIPVVLAGDYNVAPTATRYLSDASWDKDALIQPKSRAAFKALVAQGWTRRDPRRCIRQNRCSPSGTTSATAGRATPGLRLDHLLLSPALAPRLIKAGVDRDVRGEEGASDHAPAWIVLQ